MQSLIGLALIMVAEVIRGSLGPLNCKKKPGLNRVKPGLHIVGKIVSMCLRPCPKEHITAL